MAHCFFFWNLNREHGAYTQRNSQGAVRDVTSRHFHQSNTKTDILAHATERAFGLLKPTRPQLTLPSGWAAGLLFSTQAVLNSTQCASTLYICSKKQGYGYITLVTSDTNGKTECWSSTNGISRTTAFLRPFPNFPSIPRLFPDSTVIPWLFQSSQTSGHSILRTVHTARTVSAVREQCLPSNSATVGVQNELSERRDDQRGVGAVRSMNQHHCRLFIHALRRDTRARQRVFDVWQPAAGIKTRQPLVTRRVHIVTCYKHTH